MCAWIMYKMGLDMDEAIKFAKSKRRRINPEREIADLLYYYGEGLKEDPSNEFRTKYKAEKDL